MADKPTNTVHLYEHSEAKEAQIVATRLGRERDAVFFVVERDESGNGNAAWMTLFRSFFEDVGIADPAALLGLLSDYIQWLHAVKEVSKGPVGCSHNVPAARAILVRATRALCRAPKSRLAVDLTLVATRPGLANAQTIRDCQPAPVEYAAQTAWVTRLSPPSVSGKGTDAALAVDAFATLAGAVSLTRSAPKAEDPKDQHEALLTAALLETALMGSALMVCGLQTHEERVLEYAKPEFMHAGIEFALREQPVAVADTWRKALQRISGRTEKFFTHPGVWLFAMLLRCAEISRSPALAMHLLVVMEVMAREVVVLDRVAVAYAVALTVRLTMLREPLGFSARDPVPTDDALALEAERWYTLLPPPVPALSKKEKKQRAVIALSDAGVEEVMRERRALAVDPQYITSDTYRGRGVSTRALLLKHLNDVQWDEDEIGKSHGAPVTSPPSPFPALVPRTAERFMADMEPETPAPADPMPYEYIPRYEINCPTDYCIARIAAAQRALVGLGAAVNIDTAIKNAHPYCPEPTDDSQDTTPVPQSSTASASTTTTTTSTTATAIATITSTATAHPVPAARKRRPKETGAEPTKPSKKPTDDTATFSPAPTPTANSGEVEVRVGDQVFRLSGPVHTLAPGTTLIVTGLVCEATNLGDTDTPKAIPRKRKTDETPDTAEKAAKPKKMKQ